jgi:hypothetical protein
MDKTNTENPRVGGSIPFLGLSEINASRKPREALIFTLRNSCVIRKACEYINILI